MIFGSRSLLLVVSFTVAGCVAPPPPLPGLDTAAATGSSDTGSSVSATSAADESTGVPPDPNDPVCGDGVTEMPEECDLGAGNGSGAFCLDDCTTNVCGDGYVGPGEACDDGNDDNGDACTNQCGPAGCGNGVLEPPGEECDDGARNSVTGACLPSCQSASCGDQNIQAGVEACDSDNIAGVTCESEGFDGGTLFCNETCDGFTTDDCFLCGNMVQESDEDCDGIDIGNSTCRTQGFDAGPLGCTRQCTFDTSNCTICGDDSAEGAEICDGTDLGGATCASLAPGGQTAVEGVVECNGDCLTYNVDSCVYCGDGFIEGPELCELGNVGGATCAIVLQDGDYMGTLNCGADCISYDTSSCCVPIGFSCEVGQQCCSGGNCVDQGSPPGSFECEGPA